MNDNLGMLYFHHPRHLEYFLGLVVHFCFGFAFDLDFPLQNGQREDLRLTEAEKKDLGRKRKIRQAETRFLSDRKDLRRERRE